MLPRDRETRMDPDQVRLFGAVMATIQAELDWERLGRAYCEGDGSTFFDDELRERWLDTALKIAEKLSEALAGSRGRSAYIGAALAELPIMLVESLVLGRDVVWVNLPGDEMDELARVVRLASAKFGVPLPLPSFEPIESLPKAAFDHVWMVSVLTDPDHFPALHDELYERHGSELATGRGSLTDDRHRARAFVEQILELPQDGAWLSTSTEEAPLLSAPGFTVASKSVGEATAFVGDEIQRLRLHRTV